MKDISLGEYLKVLRNRLGLSQVKLAEQISLSANTISKWENNKALPDIKSLVKLSKIFDVSVDEMLQYQSDDLQTTLPAKPKTTKSTTTKPKPQTKLPAKPKAETKQSKPESKGSAIDRLKKLTALVSEELDEQVEADNIVVKEVEKGKESVLEIEQENEQNKVAVVNEGNSVASVNNETKRNKDVVAKDDEQSLVLQDLEPDDIDEEEEDTFTGKLESLQDLLRYKKEQDELIANLESKNVNKVETLEQLEQEQEQKKEEEKQQEQVLEIEDEQEELFNLESFYQEQQKEQSLSDIDQLTKIKDEFMQDVQSSMEDDEGDYSHLYNDLISDDYDLFAATENTKKMISGSHNKDSDLNESLLQPTKDNSVQETVLASEEINALKPEKYEFEFDAATQPKPAQNKNDALQNKVLEKEAKPEEKKEEKVYTKTTWSRAAFNSKFISNNKDEESKEPQASNKNISNDDEGGSFLEEHAVLGLNDLDNDSNNELDSGAFGANDNKNKNPEVSAFGTGASAKPNNVPDPRTLTSEDLASTGINLIEKPNNLNNSVFEEDLDLKNKIEENKRRESVNIAELNARAKQESEAKSQMAARKNVDDEDLSFLRNAKVVDAKSIKAKGQKLPGAKQTSRNEVGKNEKVFFGLIALISALLPLGYLFMPEISFSNSITPNLNFIDILLNNTLFTGEIMLFDFLSYNITVSAWMSIVIVFSLSVALAVLGVIGILTAIKHKKIYLLLLVVTLIVSGVLAFAVSQVHVALLAEFTIEGYSHILHMILSGVAVVFNLLYAYTMLRKK